jgi:hypothetical protein
MVGQSEWKRGKVRGTRNEEESTMAKMSRDKGKVGEREVAKLIQKYGFEARRGQQFRGAPDAPDVIHDIPQVDIEVKRVEKGLNLWDALDRTDETGTEGHTSVVFHRRNGTRWLVAIDAEDWLAEKAWIRFYRREA